MPLRVVPLNVNVNVSLTSSPWHTPLSAVPSKLKLTVGQFAVPVTLPVVFGKSLMPQVPELKHGMPSYSAGPEIAVPFWLIVIENWVVPVQGEQPETLYDPLTVPVQVPAILQVRVTVNGCPAIMMVPVVAGPASTV